MSSSSLSQFKTLLGSVDQLIGIHGKLQKGRGRRFEQDAIHRAGVVMTVAAWQAYIEKILEEALEVIGKEIADRQGKMTAPNWARQAYLMRRADIKTSIKNSIHRTTKTCEISSWKLWSSIPGQLGSGGRDRGNGIQKKYVDEPLHGLKFVTQSPMDSRCRRKSFGYKAGTGTRGLHLSC